MHSIRTKITSLMVIAILVSVVAVGVIGVVALKQSGDRSADLEMRMVCENGRMTINDYLSGIGQTVDMMARYATESLSSVVLVNSGVTRADGSGHSLEDVARTDAQIRQLDRYLENHAKQAQTVFQSAANRASGVIAYYYFINQELSDKSRGFFYTRLNGPVYQPRSIIDIFKYGPASESYVGWYYTALRRGRPSWLNPYYDGVLGVRLISYVAPIYKAGTFVGVMGMDIAENTLIERIQKLRPFDEGYAFLMDADGTMVYHPDLVEGINVANTVPALMETVRSVSAHDDEIPLVYYESDGVEKLAAVAVLDDDLRLVVACPRTVITAVWRYYIQILTLMAVVIVAIFLIVTVLNVRLITKPLVRLADASEQLVQGNYNVELQDEGLQDEVGTLTRSFQHLAAHLKIYISDLNSRAFKDALTGVKNKGAFDAFCQTLDDRILEGDPELQFAIVMMDVNGLKEMNDRYGHDKGDIYLQTASRAVCQVFAHSPVFRIGGDEFVAVLQKDDYAHREQLIEEFEAAINHSGKKVDFPWTRIDLAIGMAIYEPGADGDVQCLFKRADEAMYRRKQQIKAGRQS